MDDSLTFAVIEGCLIVTFVTINETVMLDGSDHEIIYIKFNPLNLELVLATGPTSWVDSVSGSI
jgi:hypothetical protein